jgi:hypothetical protein
VRGISDLSELYYGFGEYRLDMLEERIRAQLKETRDRHRAGKKFETKKFKKFLRTQIDFLKHMDNEIVEEDQVRVGHIDEMDIPDVVVGEEDDQRASKRTKM